MGELNKRNKKILKLLDMDARQSNIQVAKKLRVSKNVVNYNINKLEEDGLIKGYNTVVDASRLGFFIFRVCIDFYERDITVEDKIIDYLVKLSDVGVVARVVGSWDVLAEFYVKDICEFREKWFKVLVMFRKDVKQYSISLVTEQILFRRAYLSDEKQDSTEQKWVLGRGGAEKIDKIDKEVLKLLVENARTPIKDIAVKTKMSSMAIIYRMKQLVKKGIIAGYRGRIDFSKLGYQYYRVTMELEDVKKIAQLIGFCQMHPNIVGVDKTISDFDFVFDMEIANFDQFLEIIDALKIQFPGVIRDYKYFRLVEYHKRKYLPID